MNQTMQRTLEDIVAPAIEAYTAALKEHGHDWTTAYDLDNPPACICGYAPTRLVARRGAHALKWYSRAGVGQHIAAANKRANVACDKEMDRLLDEARAEGWS